MSGGAGIWIVLLAMASAPVLAIRHLRPRDGRGRLGAVVLSWLTLGFGTWFVGQGDERVDSALVAGLGLVLCLIAIQGGRRRTANPPQPSDADGDGDHGGQPR